MKKLYFSFLLLTVTFFSKIVCAQPVNELSKMNGTVSGPYALPDNAQQNFSDIYFRFSWNEKKPFKIAIQFSNHSYDSRKLKFAIKDVTTKKMILLDSVHHSSFGYETLNATSVGVVWSGPIDNPKDGLSLRVWNSNGDEFEKEPISITDQP
jgi:hypothetical protein